MTPPYNGPERRSESEHLRELFAVKSELFEVKIHSLESVVTQHFALNQLAINKAEEQMRAKLATMNEWTDTFRNLTGRYPTREEINLMVDKLNQELRGLDNFRSKMEGMASAKSVQIANALAVAGIVIALVALMFRVMGH